MENATTDEERDEAAENFQYTEKRLFPALAEYQNKFALGPFMVPQSAKKESAKE